MPDLYKAWKRDVEMKLRNLPRGEPIPDDIKTCPKCMGHHCRIDQATGKVSCPCGFEAYVVV